MDMTFLPKGVAARRALSLVLVCLAGCAFAEGPPWWTNRSVLTVGATTNDFAPVNVGQLKWIASRATNELAAYLPGGVGPALSSNLTAWLPDSSDFTPANVGQVKNIGSLFYDRFIAEGYATNNPWQYDPSASDFAPANVGQAKYVFNFDPALDTDGDGLADMWETAHGLSSTNSDTDGDGLTDGPGGKLHVYQVCGGVDVDGDGYVDGEQTCGTSPTNSDTDGDGYLDGWERQQGYSPTSSNEPSLEYGRVVVMSPLGQWNWTYFCNVVAASRYCSTADLMAGVRQRVIGIANSDAFTNVVLIVGNEDDEALRRYTAPVVNRRFDYQVPLVQGNNKIRVYAGYEYTNRFYYTGSDTIMLDLFAQAIPSNTLSMQFDSTVANPSITTSIFDAIIQYHTYGQSSWTIISPPNDPGYPTASWTYRYGTWNGSTRSITFPSLSCAYRVDVHDATQDHTSHDNTLRILMDGQVIHAETRSGVSNFTTNDNYRKDSAVPGGTCIYQCGWDPAGFCVDASRNLQLLPQMTAVGYHYQPPLLGNMYNEYLDRESNGVYNTSTTWPVYWYGVTNMALTGPSGTSPVYLNYGESAQFRATGTLQVNAPGIGNVVNTPGMNIVDCFNGADEFGVFNGSAAGNFTVSCTGCGTTIDVHVAEAPVAATLMDLDVDTDRNGGVNANDESGEDQWTTNRGAFIPAIAVNTSGTNNVQGLPPMVVQGSASVVPGQSLRLVLTRGDPWKLYMLNATGTVVNFTGTNLSLSGPYTNAQPLYPVSAYARGDVAATSPDFMFQLQQLNAAGQILLSDTVRLKVAPQILPWDGCTVERVYATALFPDTVTNIPNLVRVQSSFGQWAQDYVKPAKVQWASGQILDVFADLTNSTAGNFMSVLSQTDSVVRSVLWNVSGDGGNIMITPPLPDAPYGKGIVGTRNLASTNYFNGQGIQTNVVVLPTEWLWVGHVDEVISFINTNTVLVADPWTAANIMHTAITNGNGTNTVWFGTNALVNSLTTRSFLQVAVATNAMGAFKTNTVPTPGLPAATNNATLTFLTNTFATGDFLRVDDEILLVRTVQSNDVTVSRQKGGTTASNHTAGTCIYALTGIMQWNLPLDLQNVSTNLVAVTNALSAALGSYNIGLIKLPVLFDRTVVEGRTVFYAGSANVVNDLIFPGGSIYIQDTGCAAFDAYVTGCLSNSVFVNVWDVYHRNLGELHCGTATRRTVNLSTPWWQRVVGWQ